MPIDSRSSAQWDVLIAEGAQARRRTDAIFDLVPPALFFERPIAARLRLAFYVGHLEAFDVNLLLHAGRGSMEEPLDRLFAFGIDPMNGDLPNDQARDWPRIDVIRSYARRARGRVDAWLDDLRRRCLSQEVQMRLHAAIEHRLMHAETLAYLLNRLSLHRPVRGCRQGISPREPENVRVPGGSVLLGRRRGFGWDNEFAAHRVSVPAFRIDRWMVSNAQYLDFVEAGGYSKRRYWSEVDWRWRVRHDVRHPAGWAREGAAWFLISRADVIPFQGNWPVYVSHAEASAYARWRGCQLPSEAQWQRAAYSAADAEASFYPWGSDAPDSTRGNFDFMRWDPMPVDAHPAGASVFGLEGLLGNGWEWTCTPFAPFIGFSAAPFYPGYSADFFDGRHFVLKGGSAHTAARLLRPSFRNWFQPHFPYVFAGFRCVSEV